MVTVRILEEVDYAILCQFLSPHRASSIFLLSNPRLGGMLDHGERFQGSYYGAFEAGELVGVVAHYWNGNLVLQTQAYLEPLLQAVVANPVRPLKGVIGPDEQAVAAFDFFQLQADLFSLNSRENLYRLPLVQLQVPEALARYSVRHFQPDELALLADWNAGYAMEGLHQPDSPQLREETRQQAEFELKEKAYWVLEVAGQPVACSRFNARLPEVVQIGGVWTPPEFRGQGYARAVVAASLLDARQEGVEEAILFTAEDNLPAIKAYQALGFTQIGHYRISLLKQGLELAG